jgi:outer membrane protein TolC
VIEIITGVVIYWDLAYAYSDLEVKQETARWALNQLELSKRLAAAGMLAECRSWKQKRNWSGGMATCW